MLLTSSNLFSQETKTLYFQPESAIRATASKFYEEVTYIPLETNRRSLFGRIRELLVSDKYFIIWDDDTNSIYFFAKNGEFVKRYKPGKYNIKQIQLDRKKNALFISGSRKKFTFSQTEVEQMMEDPLNKKFARFSWSGYLYLDNIKKERVEELKNFSLALVKPTIFNGDEWIYSYIFSDKKSKDSLDYQLKIRKDSTDRVSIFPYKKNRPLYLLPQSINVFKNKGSFILTRPYDYTIYSLSRDSAKPLYEFILPAENSVSTAFLEYPFKSQGEIRNFRANNGGIIWKILNVHKQGGYLFFTLDYKKSWREKHFMYDEQTNRFYNIGRIRSDESNHYLPLISVIQYSDNEYLYGSVSSETMFRTRDNSKRRNPEYPAELLEYFGTSSREANPVIVQLKPKKEIE